MKKIVLLLLPLLLLLGSCHLSQPGNDLVEIDSLLVAQNNDEAYKKLLRIDSNDLSKDEEAYYNLLITIAEYQLYIPVKSDSVISRCITAFQANGDKEKLTRAYYYRGCITAESLNDIIGGLQNLKQAESIANSIGYKTMSLQIAALLCHFNYSSENYDIAKRYAWNVVNKAEKLDAKRWIGFGYQMLDVIYNKLGEKDSSDFYCLKSEKYIDYQNENEKYAYYRNIANAYLSMNNLEKAEKYYMLSLEKKEDIETYGALADWYAAQGEDEKAEENWQKSLHGKNAYFRSINLKKYSDWLKKKGRYTEALKYASEVIAINDSLVGSEKESYEARVVQEKYDQEKQSSKYNKKLVKVLVIVAFIVLVCVIAFIMLIRSHLRIADIEARLQENERKRHEQMALIEKLKSEGKEQSVQAKVLMRELDILNADYNEALSKGEQCYNYVKEKGNTASWRKADFIYFLEYYKRLRPDFTPNSGESYASLTHIQRFLLCLQDMGMSDPDICDILGMTKGALRTARSRIRSRME